jgi:hypothetical protein
MTNYTTSTPRTTNSADVYGLLGVGTSNTGVLLDVNSLPLFSITSTDINNWDAALQSSAIGTTVQAYDSNLTTFLAAHNLPTTPINNQYLRTNASGVITWASAINSLTFTAPTGFAVTGSPVTTGTGTIGLGFASGYSLPTTTKQTEWDTAFTNRINFVQSAIPTATAVNQLWYRPGEGLYFWNNLFWVSLELLEKEFLPIEATNNYTATTGYIQDGFIPANSYLVDAVLNFYYTAGDSSNYFTFSGNLASAGAGGYVSFSGIETRNYPITDSVEVIIPINTRITVNRATACRLTLNMTETGTSSIYVGFVVRYRRIAA